MSEKFQEGQVLEGKVTGIQPYGAFVALDEQVQGLVHISEVTHGYVKDINEHLSEGDEVQVKILNIDEKSNKYSLSIRATQEAPKQQERRPRKQAAPKQQEEAAGFNTLKDKLEDWIKQSDDREKFRK
ncbi:general stress protein 13 [Halobacillus kuroshimensis]|uniref:General stress protein 13 n=2 Tax=Halobacillus TaxID=45667 RepID=A0A845DXF7_9BACI|nr:MULTISPECIES: S1 domain-containing post-transcriptional regulator GSP13 [Halobacillus]MBN8235533.1 general stress protein 13 [Halobacillus kuroshimensis]MCA1023987.1 general stress protein 13 [Halobacillus litoralis]MYL21145.1 general stress protein 13 [Halobacillus litoralis]MYL31319.1 general stress protein 13 [Halobacillus halophilus]MYL38526.1 general stress protein 13 [Halobacillus litoralis]